MINMTPQEKAIEMYNAHSIPVMKGINEKVLHWYMSEDLNKYFTKLVTNCSLTELINHSKGARKQYWEEVKQELDKL